MGKINSIQTLGATDGPGVRYVIFTQGCPLRCSCCHNPDTWDINHGKEETAENLMKEILRYKSYFGKNGGITISGGEPLMQSEFVREIFILAKANNIHTCLDTSGFIINEKVKQLLELTDLVLLDIKYTNQKDYQQYVGGSYYKVLEFLEYLNEKNVPTWIRQVAIPSLNMTKENYEKLKSIKENHSNVTKIEILPFRKLCTSKYENLRIVFPLKNEKEPTKEQIAWVQKKLKGHY